MAVPRFGWLRDVGLLVADVPWAALLPALREVSGEGFEVRAAVIDWGEWRRQPPPAFPQLPLLAGDYQGRSYLIDDTLILPATGDRVVALAARTGGTVLGLGYQDITATSTLTAARGADLLRYVFDCNAGRHEEGVPLPGEVPGASARSPHGFRNVLARLGFDVDAWLQRGAKWDVVWTMLTRDEQPGAHARLYFGPLRQRIEALQRAAFDEF